MPGGAGTHRPAPPGRPVEVATDRGRVRAVRDGDVLRWVVPYAAAPAGDLRWRPPVPHGGWAGVLDGHHLPPAPQPGAADGTEDCLHLRVTAPAAASDPLPVLVWFHGGGFEAGRAEEPHTRPHHLAAAGAVVVGVTYRLGVLGWLHLGDHDDDLADSGNAGLLDQVAALAWVRRNIAGFGGDPTRVTAMGQSAGAMGIAAVAAAAPGSFDRAILQSGAADHVLDRAQAAAVADRVLHRLGLAGAGGGRAVPVDELLRAQAAVGFELVRTWRRQPEPGRFLAFSPVTGTPSLPRPPIDDVRAGRTGPLRIIVGANADEAQVLVRGDTSEAVFREWATGIGAPDPDRLWSAYADPVGGSAVLADAAARSDVLFRLPGARLARAVAEGGGTAWHYDFRWPSSLGDYGATHGLELCFVFGTLHDPGAERSHAGAPPRLAEVIRDAWASMAADGRPAAPGLRWSPHAPSGTTLVLDAEPHEEQDVMAGARALWGPDLAPD